MRKNHSLIILVALTALNLALAQHAKATSPNGASNEQTTIGQVQIEQYLMDRSEEIAMARTAAPESVSRDAEVMVFERHGFETAVKGKNGFVCIVERSWTSAPDPDFWNSKVRTPICYNAAAAHTFLARNLKRTSLILAGRTKAQTDEAIYAAVDKGELPAIEPGAMCYMMSKLGYGGDSVLNVPGLSSHVMFFYSGLDPSSWGANLPGSPIIAVSDISEHPSEHLTEFAVGVGKWSDGTEVRGLEYHHH